MDVGTAHCKVRTMVGIIDAKMLRNNLNILKEKAWTELSLWILQSAHRYYSELQCFQDSMNILLEY